MQGRVYSHVFSTFLLIICRLEVSEYELRQMPRKGNEISVEWLDSKDAGKRNQSNTSVASSLRSPWKGSSRSIERVSLPSDGGRFVRLDTSTTRADLQKEEQSGEGVATVI